MAADIVPELYENILSGFNQGIKSNKRIQKFYTKLEERKATGEDVSRYSAELGRCAANVLNINLVPDKLPDGRLYWNIAQRTIKPLMQEVHQLVMAAAVQQMQVTDRKAGIGMKPVESKFPEDRVDDLIDTICRYWEEDMDEG